MKLGTQRNAASGVLLVICIAALIAGLAFDLIDGAHASFWIANQAGAAAAIGASGAVFAVLAWRGVRLTFGRGEEGGDASADS